MVQCNMERKIAASKARLPKCAGALLRCVRAGGNHVARMLVVPVLLAVPPAAMAQESAPQWPRLLRQDLARVARIEWRLRKAAGNSCPVNAADAGLIIDDRRSYQKRDWPLLERTLGMREYPVIVGIAPGSPASLAGLREGDEVLSLANISVETIEKQRKPESLVADALLETIAQAIPDSEFSVVVRRNGVTIPATLRPVRHCAARIVLATDRSIDAHSDDRNIAISTGMVAFARTDDELALVVGHELAHVINRDRRGSGISARRTMEDRADELGLRLMVCAGYDRDLGIALFARLDKRDWLGFLRAPTHRSWPARIARLRALPDHSGCPIAKP
ncbi:Beta-barrel assembly-enhancing protease [Novosphingobium sp. CECT 9465]|nr:Beta-barrel assembly-enhancing protease [Novosphingobium sp. CECT 9465]